MKRILQLTQWKEDPQEGILFVRIVYTLTVMVKAPIIAVCLLMVTLTSLPHHVFGAPKILDFTIYADGTTHVFYQAEVDPLTPDSTIDLFGKTIDNFVVQDENDLLLSSKIETGIAVIETLGASEIKIDYDTADLVTKNGKIWTFSIDSQSDYSVLLPKNTVIVGMSTTPLNMQVVDEQSLISLPSGSVEINYFFGVLGTEQTATLAIEKARDLIDKINSEDIKTPLASAKLVEAVAALNEGKFSSAEVIANEAKNLAIQEQQTALNSDPNSNPGSNFNILENPIIPITIAIAGAAAITVILVKKSKTKKTVILSDQKYEAPDKETIFRLKPELRQDDKDIVTFISESGGQVYESDLRKKFLLPRTTTWRAVKRLEREGIVEIEKVDKQNLIRLRKAMEENQG